ncbi:hypothetical protein FQZ97_839080 [compost metagenome]
MRSSEYGLDIDCTDAGAHCLLYGGEVAVWHIDHLVGLGAVGLMVLALAEYGHRCQSLAVIGVLHHHDAALFLLHFEYITHALFNGLSSRDRVADIAPLPRGDSP